MKKYTTKFGDFSFPVIYVDRRDDAFKVIRRLGEHSKPCGLDIETRKLEKFKEHPKAGLCPHLSSVRLLQIYDGEHVWVFDLMKIGSYEEMFNKALLGRSLIAHNAVFELSHLKHFTPERLRIGCSNILSKLIYTAEHSPFDPEPEEEAELEDQPDGLSKYKYSGHTLEDACGREFGIRLDKTLQTSDWSAPELSAEQIRYAGADAFLTYELGKKFMKKVKDYKMERHYSLLKKLQHVVVDMQLEGFPVNWKEHERLVNKWDDAQGKAQRECYGYFGDTNLNSGQQLSKWLERYLKREPEVLMRWPKTDSGKNYSFNKLVLAKFRGYKAVDFLLQYKEYSKLLSTYGESFATKKHPVTGRVHCGFTIGDTRTGRMSSRDPNLQQWPRGETRKIFGLPDKKMVVCDFSMIEVRLQGEISRDPVMRRIFKESRDIYCEFASHIYRKKISKEKNPEERKFGKEAVLSLAYGMGANTFCGKAATALKRPVHLEEGQIAWDGYRSMFKEYINWCDRERSRAKQLGFARTVLGKMRHLNPDEVYTKAPNHVIQGSSFELMALSMLNAWDNGVKLINVVHDELICICHNEEETVEKVNYAMNGAFKFMFPKASTFEVAEAKAGSNWFEAKGD